MQLNFLVASSNEMVDDMGGRSVTTGTAKPLVAGQALDNAARIVNTAIPFETRNVSEDVAKREIMIYSRARMWRKLLLFLQMPLVVLAASRLGTGGALYIVVSGSFIVIIMPPRTKVGICVIHLHRDSLVA